jgi:hypothetical protein
VNEDLYADEVYDDEKDEKLNYFLNDPETAIKIFMSSFMIKQGLIWYVTSTAPTGLVTIPNTTCRSDRHLVSIPCLVSFFLKFLIRNRVLPEAAYDQGLRRALVIVDLAKKELPLTSKIAKAFPDKIHLAFRGCWDPKSEGYQTLNPINVNLVDEPNDEPDAKRQKMDEGADINAKAIEDELRAHNVEIVKPGAGISLAKEIIEDNVDGVTWGGSGSWGDESTAGGWGDSVAMETSAWGNDTSVDVAASWAAPVHSLLPFLGPTALPITHAAGIVEASLRRVKSLTPPLMTPIAPIAISQAEGPDAVEAVLDRMFAKVVLEPWLGWDVDDHGSLSKPRILESSRGPVVSACGTNGPAENAQGERPHNPFKDEITVLVDPAGLESLSVGIGIGATWVQIARQNTKNTRSTRERFWYIDELTMTLPSYYTALPVDR